MKKLTLSLVFILASCFTVFADCETVHLSQFNPPAPPADAAQVWRDAFEVLADCKGGTLDISGTETDIRSTVIKNFLNLATQITIKGNGSNSRIRIDVGGVADGFVFQNLQDLIIEKVTFVGGGIQGAHTSDHRIGVSLVHTHATIRHNSFYGLGAITPDSAVIKVGDSSSAIIERNKFRGCRTSSGLPSWTGTIVGDNYGGLSIVHNEFWDYGSLPNGDGTYTYYTTNAQAGMAWITLLNPNNSDVGSTPSVVISDNFFDEGSYFTVITVSNVQLQSMKLNRNRTNVGAGAGYVLRNIKYLEIDGGLVGWRPASYAPTDAIQLINVQYPTIKNFVIGRDSSGTMQTSANRLTVDSGTIMLRVRDSKFATIVNNAQSWQIEDGGMVASSQSLKLRRN